MPLPTPQPETELWPGIIRQTPGNVRPRWERLGLPLTVLRAPRGPCKVWPPGQGGRTPGQARPLPQPGQAAAPLPSGPHSPPNCLNQSSPNPPNSWCFQGNYLMNQQCGDLWRQNGSRVGFSPSTRPTGHRGHLWGSRAPCPPPPPTGSYPQHPEG